MDTHDAFARALALHRSRLAMVRADQWQAATPCKDWDVHALANHVLGEVCWVPPLLEGKTIAEVGDALSGDLLGSDALQAWDAAADAATASAAAEGAMQRTVRLSYGDTPASDYLAEVTADLVIHTWDLARAIGAEEQLDPELVTMVTATMAPRLEAWRGAGALAPARDPGPDADEQARLIAATGRDPR